MQDYKSIINKNKNDFIKEFKNIPQNSESETNNIIKILDDYESASSSLIDKYNLYNLDIKNKQKDIENYYKDLYLKKENEFNSDINKYLEESSKKIKELKNEIENLSSSKKEKIAGYKEEITNNTAKTNPLIYNQLLIKNKDINLYEIYKKKQYNKYNDIVNDLIEKKNTLNEQLVAANNKYMFRYNKANDSIIDLFEQKMQKFIDENKEIDSRLHDLKVVYDKKILDLEINFNNEVRKISSEINTNITFEANQYGINTNEIDSSMDKRLKDIQKNRSQINKEFITSIESINTKINLINNNTKRHINHFKKQCGFKLHEIDTLINKVYENAYYNNTDINKSLLNNLIKSKIDVVNNCNHIILVINNKNKKVISRLIDEKAILEKIKNTNILKIDAIEEIERNNYENKYKVLKENFNYKKNILNQTNDLKAAESRFKYSSIKYEIIKNYKNKQTEYFMKKALNQLEIDYLNVEISLSRDLEKQVIDTDSLQRRLNTNKNNLHYLLEIEKNKALKDYNIYHIDNSINKSNIIYNYEETNLFLNRDKKNELLNMNIKKVNIDHNHNKKLCGFDILETSHKEVELKNRRKAKYSYEISKEKIDENFKHFENNKNLILYEFDTLKKLITPQINFIFNYQLNLKNNIKNSINFENYLATSSLIYKYILKSILSLMDISKSNVLFLIDDQINFETGSKYENMIETYKTKYNENIKDLTQKKDNIKSTIKNYNDAIKSFYQQLAINESNKAQAINKFKNNKITRHELNKILNNTKNDEARFHKLIFKNEELIDKFNKTLDLIPIKEKYYKKEFEKNKARIEKEKNDEFKTLYNFSSLITNLFDNSKRNILLIDTNINAVDLNKLSNILSNISKRLTNIFNKFIKKYLNYIIDLENNVSKKVHTLNIQNNKDYLYNILSHDKTAYIDSKRLQNNIKDENNKYSFDIKRYNLNCDDIISSYNKKMQDNKDKYNNSVKKLTLDLNDKYELYHTRVISTSLNINDNILENKKAIKKLTDYNAKANMDLVKSYSNLKNQTKINNQNTIRNYKETITYLPIELKETINNLKNDLKIYKNNLNNEEKINKLNLNLNIKNLNNITYSSNNKVHNNIAKYNKALLKYDKLLNKNKFNI